MKNSYLLLLGCSISGCLNFTNTLCAQAGSPDLSFGNAGTVITDVGAFNEAFDMVVQPDGKIVVGGYANVTGNDDFAVTRYLINGTLDTAFGNGGTATIALSVYADQANTVLLQTDGKIILAGFANSGSGNADFAVARFLADGTPDITFGVMGKVTTDLTGDNDYGYAAGLQSDGKIVLAGPATGGPGGDVGLIRYTTSGILDSSFDLDGMRLADVNGNGGYDCALALAIQADGKIVTAGYSWNGTNYDFALARFDASGSYDNTFGTNGTTMTPVGPAEDICLSIALQADGKIVVAGYTWDAAYTNTDYAVVRYLVNGTPDPAFGVNGIATGAISTTFDYLRAVAIQPDGKIVGAGQTSAPGFTDIGLIRLTSSGIPDSTFNGTGMLIDDVIGEQDYALAVCIQSDRKILVAGATLNSGDVDLVVTRYLGDPELGVADFNLGATSMVVYPNPVSTSCTVSYNLSVSQEVSIRLLDTQGKLVAVLRDNEMQCEGEHVQLIYLPVDLASGSYFIELNAASGTSGVQIVK